MNVERSSLFLMANLGSEVSRMISCFEGGEDKEVAGALGRALEILKKIREFPEMGPRGKEFDLLERALKESIKKNSPLSINHAHLKSYFHPFVIRQMQLLYSL